MMHHVVLLGAIAMSHAFVVFPSLPLPFVVSSRRRSAGSSSCFLLRAAAERIDDGTIQRLFDRACMEDGDGLLTKADFLNIADIREMISDGDLAVDEVRK